MELKLHGSHLDLATRPGLHSVVGERRRGLDKSLFQDSSNDYHQSATLVSLGVPV